MIEHRHCNAHSLTHTRNKVFTALCRKFRLVSGLLRTSLTYLQRTHETVDETVSSCGQCASLELLAHRSGEHVNATKTKHRSSHSCLGAECTSPVCKQAQFRSSPKDSALNGSRKATVPKKMDKRIKIVTKNKVRSAFVERKKHS